MPALLLILEIILTGEKIALRIIEDMPADQKAEAWKQHGEAQQFWRTVFDGFRKRFEKDGDS